MNESDIEFTVGLDVSDADRKLDAIQQKLNSTFNESGTSQGYSERDAFAYERMRLIKEKNDLNRAARAFYSEAYSRASSGDVRSASILKANAVDAAGEARDREQKIKFYNEKIKEIDKQFLAETGITDENKAQNREFSEQIVKLGKIFAIVTLIKKAVDAIKKAWEGAFNIHQETLQNLGFLSKDPEGAFRANSDKTREIMYAGIANWGKAAPFTRQAYDELATRIQIAKENAMKGYGVDEHLTIAAQALTKYGTGFNAVQLLTGDPNRTNTDITNEILNAIEKSLPNIARLPEKDRSRTLGYIRDLVGPEMMDRLMANVNLNLRSGSTETSVEKILSRGGSVVTSVNYAKAGKEFTDSASEMSEAFKSLHYVLLGRFSPMLSKVADSLEKFANWLADKFHLGEMDKKTRASITKGEKSAATLDMLDVGISADVRGTANQRLYDLFNKTTRYGLAYDYSDIKEDSKYLDLVKGYKNIAAKTFANPNATPAETFQALVYQNPAYAAGKMGATLENMRIHAVLETLFNMQNEFGEDLSENRFAEMYGGGTGEFYQFGGFGALVAKELKSKGKKFGKLEDFIKFAVGNKAITLALQSLVNEGGSWDITPKDVASNAYGYVTGGIPEASIAKFKNDLWRSATLGNTGGMFQVGGDLTVHVTDVYGREVKTETVPLKQKGFAGAFYGMPAQYRNTITVDDID